MAKPIVHTESRKEIEKLLNTFDNLKTSRRVLESEWEELAQIFTPGTQNFTKNAMPWSPTNRSVDNHGSYFAQKLASYLFGQSCNPSTKFVKFFVADKSKSLSFEEKIELDKINDRILDAFASSKSNFASAIQETLYSLVVFGPGIVFLDNQLGKDIIFKSIPLSQVYFAENNNGRVDTVYRSFNFTAKQMVQAFGIDKVSENVVKAFSEKPETEFELLHCTYPSFDETAPKNKKYESCYIEVESKNALSCQYFSHMPFIVSRWARHTGEKYGHGQGKIALSVIREMSHIRREISKSMAFQNSPVILSADDGVLIPENIRPGQVIHGAMSSLDGMKRLEMWSPSGNGQAGMAMYEMAKDLLGKIFFAEDVNLPIDKTRRTATEVSIMRNDQIRFLTPYVARLIYELFKPMAETVLQMLAENGVFNDLQTDVLKYELEPDFLGPVTNLLKMEDVHATQTFLQNVLPLVQLDQTILDRIDFAEVLKDAQKGTGTPEHIMRSEDAVAELQKQKQIQAQQMQQMQGATGASEIAMNLARANHFNGGAQ